jgi:hypothetical protein
VLASALPIETESMREVDSLHLYSEVVFVPLEASSNDTTNRGKKYFLLVAYTTTTKQQSKQG